MQRGPQRPAGWPRRWPAVSGKYSCVRRKRCLTAICSRGRLRRLIEQRLKGMIEKPAAHTDLTCHLHRLLEVVKGTACALEGRWRWLARPMALVVWVLTRRERREAAETMRAMQGMLEAFLAMFEDFRAGRLVAESAPEVVEAREEDGRTPALPGC